MRINIKEFSIRFIEKFQSIRGWWYRMKFQLNIKHSLIFHIVIIAILESCQVKHASSLNDNTGIVYPPECKAVIDVTKPPYNLDNTGKEDCTEKLVALIDSLTWRTIMAIDSTKSVIAMNTDTFLIFCSTKYYGYKNPAWDRKVVLPHIIPHPKIIYFPNGIYRVSNTITYTHENLQNEKGAEMNWFIIMQGQSKKGVTIKLDDHAKDFQNKENPKAVISYMQGAWTNTSFHNKFENFTIDVGKGNPGAIGIEFNSNNTGAMRNVDILSSDPEYAGFAGLVDRSKPSVLKNITINGFDYAAKLSDSWTLSVFEHVTISNQKIAGIYANSHNIAIRDLKSNNVVPAIMMDGPESSMVITGSELNGGSKEQPAIIYNEGFALVKSVITSGYNNALTKNGKIEVPGNTIQEYNSHGPVTLFNNREKDDFDLTVEENPVIPWEKDFSKWVSVTSFGAIPDDGKDDSEAIQKAMNSERPVVYFQPGLYTIDQHIDIPSTVQRVNFMFCNLEETESLGNDKNHGIFRVTGENDAPLIIEDIYCHENLHGAKYLVEHASKRTLVLSDMMALNNPMYFNSVPGGKVFIENVSSLCTFRHWAKLKGYRERNNCYAFNNQQVWCRGINSERADTNILNNGSDLWVLGFKEEARGCAYATINQGKTQVLGGYFNRYGLESLEMENELPAVINDNSTVYIFAYSLQGGINNERVVIREIQDKTIHTIKWKDLPVRNERKDIVIPYYKGGR